jgi:hypothetical protein
VSVSVSFPSFALLIPGNPASHFLYLLSPTPGTPLQGLIPGSTPSEASIPLPRIFALLALFLHLNLSFHLYPSKFRQLAGLPQLNPIPYKISYYIASISPILSLLLWMSWTTIMWWSLTLVVIVAIHSVQTSMEEGNESLGTLAELKYTSFGA